MQAEEEERRDLARRSIDYSIDCANTFDSKPPNFSSPWTNTREILQRIDVPQSIDRSIGKFLPLRLGVEGLCDTLSVLLSKPKGRSIVSVHCDADCLTVQTS